MVMMKLILLPVVISFLSPLMSYAQKDSVSIDENLEDDATWDEFADELTPKEEKEVSAENQVVVTPKEEVAVEKKEESAEKEFVIGPEEEKLIQISQTIAVQISNEEWASITKDISETSYTVQKNDWLFKISKKLFGTGFYYPKIWSMNGYIENPHEIEPGMVLTLTQAGDAPPQLSMGSTELAEDVGSHKWFQEKKALAAKDIYITSNEEDVKKIMGSGEVNREYDKYHPAVVEIARKPDPNQYDSTGIEKVTPSAVYKQGYYLNTFITTNELKVLGNVDSKKDEASTIRLKEIMYVTLNPKEELNSGDLVSAFLDEGMIDYEGSDRTGRKYTIAASIKLLQKIDAEKNLWEAQVTDVFMPALRGAKLTTYMPKIEKIERNLNSKVIEGVIFSGFREFNTHFTFGDVLYIDRGSADGVEIGNVFDIFDQKDRGTLKPILEKPTYRTGELTIISITDNFATAIVTKAIMDFGIGDVVRTKSSEVVSPLADASSKSKLKSSFEALSVGDELAKRRKDPNLSEQELKELERLKGQQTFALAQDQSEKELDELEADLAKANESLKATTSKDGLDLNAQAATKDYEDTQVDIEAVEQKYGKKYIEGQIPKTDNPYGLSQYDVEEVDELLNSDEVKSSPSASAVKE
jgi:hypothetical protein